MKDSKLQKETVIIASSSFLIPKRKQKRKRNPSQTSPGFGKKEIQDNEWQQMKRKTSRTRSTRRRMTTYNENLLVPCSYTCFVSFINKRPNVSERNAKGSRLESNHPFGSV